MDKIKDFGMSMFGRKFLILVLGTALLWFDKIGGTEWIVLASAYYVANQVEKKIKND